MAIEIANVHTTDKFNIWIIIILSFHLDYVSTTFTPFNVGFLYYQELADYDIAQLPRDAYPTRIHKRCVLTSRPRGLVSRYRLSRIQWRLLADYNKLSGVTRASW